MHLPDTKDSYPIPDKWRLPFNGKMETPTVVPSTSERHQQIDLIEGRRRRRRILIGVTAAAAVAAGVALLFLLKR